MSNHPAHTKANWITGLVGIAVMGFLLAFVAFAFLALVRFALHGCG